MERGKSSKKHLNACPVKAQDLHNFEKSIGECSLPTEVGKSTKKQSIPSGHSTKTSSENAVQSKKGKNNLRTRQEAFELYIRQGKIQTGADLGCVRCIELVDIGRSSKRHMKACPAADTTPKKVSDLNKNIKFNNDLEKGNTSVKESIRVADDVNYEVAEKDSGPVSVE